MMHSALSILIPTRNDRCLLLAAELSRQARLLLPGGCEIIVADDGSDDNSVRAENRRIDGIPLCRYIERDDNVGRAAIRNFLAREARHPLLLFIDSDMTLIADNFLNRYLKAADGQSVIDGGIRVTGDEGLLRGNLRYRYEKAAEPAHTADKRQRNPYRDFHTANFLIPKRLMLEHPFDERYRNYGYEDVLFGKTLRQCGIPVVHIDNPVGFGTFERNDDFIRKTEEGLRTLYRFRDELRGYSRLITAAEGIHISIIVTVIRLLYRGSAPLLRRQLCGAHPSLRLFDFYKLGYYLCLHTDA